MDNKGHLWLVAMMDQSINRNFRSFQTEIKDQNKLENLFPFLGIQQQVQNAVKVDCC